MEEVRRMPEGEELSEMIPLVFLLKGETLVSSSSAFSTVIVDFEWF